MDLMPNPELSAVSHGTHAAARGSSEKGDVHLLPPGKSRELPMGLFAYVPAVLPGQR